MKITEICLSNFRAFVAPPEGLKIELPHGENLLVYGENGAGKSSLYGALQHFFNASGANEHSFAPHQNCFQPTPAGYVRLRFKDDNEDAFCWQWSDARGDFLDVSDDSAIVLRDANKSKGFIDYKALLQTYFVGRTSEDEVNLFSLLVETLLADIENNVTQNTFAFDWETFRHASETLPRFKKNVEYLSELQGKFNQGLRRKLDELEKVAAEFLTFFGYHLKANFVFTGVGCPTKKGAPIDDRIGLKLQFFDIDIARHHEFLNEAKLSALALSIFLAALQVQPVPAIKLLAFDDVLIGLDMSNRLPILDLLKAHFSDYQIVLTTYDRVWFEIVKRHTNENWPSKWRNVEMFVGQMNGFETPVLYTKRDSLLAQAHAFFEAHQYKAAAVYARTHFEILLKDFCSEKRLPVKYHTNTKKVSCEDFWTAAKTHKVQRIEIIERRNGRGELVKTEEKQREETLISSQIVRQVEEARTLILNPLSHSEEISPLANEVDKALRALTVLEEKLREA